LAVFKSNLSASWNFLATSSTSEELKLNAFTQNSQKIVYSAKLSCLITLALEMSQDNEDLSNDVTSGQIDSDAFVPLSTEIDESTTQNFCSQCEASGISIIVEHVELRELETRWPAFRLLVPLSQLEKAAILFDRLRNSKLKRAAA
jgi:hypothetical protein